MGDFNRNRNRAYDGQDHTHYGERGTLFVTDLTLRDLNDCFIRACFRSSGLTEERYPDDIYELPWDKIDPVAIGQNLTCEVEKAMGVFPNTRQEVESG